MGAPHGEPAIPFARACLSDLPLTRKIERFLSNPPHTQQNAPLEREGQIALFDLVGQFEIIERNHLG